MALAAGQPLDDIQNEAERILKLADANKVVLKLIGGMAVKLLSPSSRSGPLSRPYPNDLDFAGYSSQSTAIRKLFTDLGYTPNQRFNALHGRTRLQFIDEEHHRLFDVFLDVFKMCHLISLKERLSIDGPTLPTADILLTKLQIVRLNEKDVKDSLCLIGDDQLGETDTQGILNTRHLAKLCAEDWGLHKTVTTNLSHLTTSIENYQLDTNRKQEIKQKIAKITETIENEPKTLKWKLRAKVGEKMPWYELPETSIREIGKTYETEAKS